MELYDYQKRVARYLRSNKSVVLQAPTGAGKTFAALYPFLESWDRESKTYPCKCVYVVPMRVLANQFTSSTRNLLKEMVIARQPKVEIQTGDQPKDKRFESDVIFCTVDQFLSSYLTMPYSLPRRLANLNAGAMVGSYIVFDEFHLLDPSSTLPTVMYALKQLREVAPVLVMTATFSGEMLKNLADELDAQVELVPQEEAHAIELREKKDSPRQRVWRTANEFLSAQAVLDAHRSRSLAICNTVRGAQKLFRELRALKDSQTRLLLLHSRFLLEDRQETEKDLKQLFGKENDRSGSVIAVATQTIEVGVDITSEVLHTELAPASSLIQRAGRCARYPGEQGEVIVYRVESYMPYGKGSDEDEDQEDDSRIVSQMRNAFAWLQERSGDAFDFEKELALVNAVATPHDRETIRALESGRVNRRSAIERVLIGDGQGDDSRLLIRNADSRLVLIHHRPDDLLDDPYNATGFSIERKTLFGMVKDWLNREGNFDWRVKMLVEDDDKNEEGRTDYGWKELHDIKLLTSTRAIVVNPELSGYWKDEGFVAERGGSGWASSLPLRAAGQPLWENIVYKKELYEDHIRRVLEALGEIILPELKYPAQELDRVAQWAKGSIEQAAWLVCLLHDVGKLDVKWQGWARAYQKEIKMPIEMTEALGHTEYDRRNEVHVVAEKTVAKRGYKKPHHAGEGAMATSAILAQVLDKRLAKAAMTAITRHHTPFAKECKIYKLEDQSKIHIKNTLVFVPAEVQASIDLRLVKVEEKSEVNSLPDYMATPSDNYGWMAYILLARALRRADQEGTSRGTKKEGAKT